MASYIIAGPAGDESFSECEYLGKQLELSTKAAVTVVMKHPDEWDEYLKKVQAMQVCHSFGFYRPVTPIVFTSDGKYIGGLEHFKDHVFPTQLRRLYQLDSDLKKPERMSRAELDLTSSEVARKLAAAGPGLVERVRKRLEEIRAEGQIQIIDGYFRRILQNGLEVSSSQFFVKESQLLTPTSEDLSHLFGKELPFVHAPELPFLSETPEATTLPADTTKENPADNSYSKESQSKESSVEEESEGMASPDLSIETDKKLGNESGGENEEEPDQLPVEPVETPDLNDSLVAYQVTDFNLKDFIRRFQGLLKKKEAVVTEEAVTVPKTMKTVCIPDTFVVEAVSDGFVLAAHPFPMVPGQLFVFQGEHTDQEGRWLVRDTSLTPNWQKLFTIPPQHPVFQDQSPSPVSIPGLLQVYSHSGNLLSTRGYTLSSIDLAWMAPRNSALHLAPLSVTITHVLTELDWKVWLPLVRETGGVGFYQWLPYGAQK